MPKKMEEYARKIAAKMGIKTGLGIKMTMLYEGDFYATVESHNLSAGGFGFFAKPETSIEGVPDEIFVNIIPPTTSVGKAIGNYWGAHVRKGDRIFMKGKLHEVELLHWGAKPYMFDCNLLFNETIKSGYGLRDMKKKKSHFKGQISGTITGLISNNGSYELRVHGSSDFRNRIFFSIGLKLEKEIEGLPEEITVHLNFGHTFSIGDEGIFDGEIYSVKLKGTDFEIYEMQAEHYLNKKNNMGF